MPELLHVPDHHRPFGPEQQRQCRSNITLAGLINHDQIKKSRFKRNTAAHRQRGHRPTGQNV